jgi:hypothetical protein
MAVEPLSLSIKHIVATTGQGRPSVFDAIREGHLKTFLVGRKRFAKYKDVQAWVDFLEKQSSKGKPVCYRGKWVDTKAQSALGTAGRQRAVAARKEGKHAS